MGTNPSSLNQSPEMDEAYLARPMDWRLDKRRVYNYRRIMFRLPAKPKDPAGLVESCLLLAFELSANQGNETKWIEFLDAISHLQMMNLTELSERDRTAVLLNIYHVMVLHGNLVLGPPGRCLL